MSRNVADDMQIYLPKYYGDSKHARNVTDREAEEISVIHAQIQDVLRQFFIDTATWGLAKWEEICGIPFQDGKPLDQRRSYIKSKLRGAGTVTAALIKSVVESFQNGNVDVEEKFGTYEIHVTFVGNRGIPPDLEDVRKTLREVVPAHLDIVFKFTYLRWEELDAADVTWEELEALDFTWNELEVWKP